MLKNYYILITAIVFSLFISGCKNNSNFSIEEFNPLANYSTKKNDSTYIIKTKVWMPC